MLRLMTAFLWFALAPQVHANACAEVENSFDAPITPQGGPVEVNVHLYLNDLTEIRDARESFVGDVFLRGEWQDRRLAHAGPEPCSADPETIWTPRMQLLNRRQLDQVGEQQLVVEPDGSVRQVIRVYGEFSFRQDLTDFPFDQQTLRFVLGSNLGPEVVALKAEPKNIGTAESLSVANWRISTLGSQSSERYIAPVERTISTLEIDFLAERLTGFYTWQLLVPLALVVMMTWTVFWMPLEFVAPRVGLVATSMLTLIAYRFSMTSVLPPIAYLTRLDKFMVAASILVFGALAAAVAISYFEHRGHDASARRLNYVSRVLAPLSFLAVYWMVFLE
jgi:hypothetical protein